ncbi:MAG: site-2 protease family protein, partial [Clostridia bacterium]|nr:site-2 protease family protein [Clostridia bacterium]
VYQLVIYLFLYYFYYLNLVLTVFNLLPIPPFDGSRIFLQFLPEKVYFSVMKYERKIMLGFFAFYLIANTVERLTGIDINFISMGIRWVISYLEKGLMAVFRHLPFAQ